MTVEQATPDGVDHVEAATMALFARMHAPGIGPQERRRVREQIIADNLPFATRLAHRYRLRGQDDDVLEQVAALGLVKAVNGFDPRRGKPFFGYLIPTVTGELKRHFRDKGWRVHVGRQLQERCLEFGRVRAQLHQTLRRQPTIAELAQALGGPQDEVVETWIAASAYDVDSLNARVSDTDDSAELQDLLGQDDADLAGACDRLALRELLRRLPELEQYVLTRYFFGDATQEQIAHSLGVSQMQVSRLLRRTLHTLHRQLDGDDDTPAPATTAQITAATTAGHTAVTVTGDLDQASAARLRDTLVDTAVRTRPRRLIVDLTRAGQADGAIVRALVDGHRATGHSGTTFMVTGIDPVLFERLRRLGVTRLFPCRPSHRATAHNATEPIADAHRRPATPPASPQASRPDAPRQLTHHLTASKDGTADPTDHGDGHRPVDMGLCTPARGPAGHRHPRPTHDPDEDRPDPRQAPTPEPSRDRHGAVPSGNPDWYGSRRPGTRRPRRDGAQPPSRRQPWPRRSPQPAVGSEPEHAPIDHDPKKPSTGAEAPPPGPPGRSP
ncbi:SigB/SigF/SigG family RNA polymerase sigma factor [Actinoplanes sp. KI2]|uniref:SigB/SigF/SigG family RNA polymerase sigma factor n=1 Tax=Actinoplanes sp. KI2 TaxID=2983315 RepID=UPI0021D5A0A8|nr:SigB/SigF/SigG family RNA polymerase sigma factor [Actinoplanes sp. KI2]MCU7730314.1 SigB/SigF/SigG family RNA polymerase sigma factor [Actinoplanes sp. KI2]